MRARDPTVWMWSEALDVLAHAERLQRQCFQLAAHRQPCPVWEPPVDIFETEAQFILLAALPGVTLDQLFVTLDGVHVSVHGKRPMPDLGAGASIHRIEIPYGRFERRIALPGPASRLGSRLLRDGCLLLTLDKAGSP